MSKEAPPGERADSPAAAGPEARAAARSPASPRGLALAVTLVAAAAVLRLLASRGDLWLDEIWSLQFARGVQAPIEVLTRLHHDNNHCLVTWWMWLVSGSGSDWILRLPSLLASVATVVLAGLVGRRAGGRMLAVFAIILTGGSYLLIHYGSEARGYAPAGAFALGAWYCALRGLEGRRRLWPALFWIAVVLGMLSHATFIAEAYGGLLVWSLYRLRRREQQDPQGWSWARLCAAAARWHAVPVLAILLFSALHLRHMQIGGGPQFSWRFVFGRLSAFAVGLPAQESGALLPVAVGAALLVLGIWTLRRRGSDFWLLHAANCLVFPALLLLLRQPEQVFERYFFVSAVFFVMMLAQLLAYGIVNRGAVRVSCLVLAVSFLTGNAEHTARLLRDGRGRYFEALGYIRKESAVEGDTIRVASDHDFRNRLLVEHHAARLPAGRPIAYVLNENLGVTGADWMILHSRERSFPPDTEVDAGDFGVYRFRRGFLSAPMSGFCWTVLRLEPRNGSSGGDPVR